MIRWFYGLDGYFTYSSGKEGDIISWLGWVCKCVELFIRIAWLKYLSYLH